MLPLVDSGSTIGLQVAVRTANQTVSVAIGKDAQGNEISTDSVSNFFCLCKTLTTLTFQSIEETNPGFLSTRLSDVDVASGSPIADVTIWEILTHSSGIWGDSAEWLMGVSDETAIERIIAGTRSRPRFRGIYGQFGAFHIAGLVAERLLGVPMEALVRAHVLDALVSDNDVYFRNTDLADRNRMRVSGSRREHGVIPWLWEMSTIAMTQGSAANGCYATAGGFLGILEMAAANARSGKAHRAALAQQCTKPGRDPILQRVCSFSLGHLFDLTQHGFGDTISRWSFGQVGLGGATTCGVDLESDVLFCWRDYLVHESVSQVHAIRSTVMNAIRESVATPQ